MPPRIDRADYQGRPIDEIADPNEPVFVIRAQDVCSGPTVRVWAMMAKKAGANPDIVESALRHADLMDAWPNKKIPDLPKPTRTQFEGRKFMVPGVRIGDKICSAFCVDRMVGTTDVTDGATIPADGILDVGQMLTDDCHVGLLYWRESDPGEVLYSTTFNASRAMIDPEETNLDTENEPG